MNWRHWRYRLEYFAFRCISLLPLVLSPRNSAAAARGLAFIIHRVLPRKWTRYQIAKQNIRHAFGDRFNDEQIDRLIYEMWVHLFRVVCEILQLRRKYVPTRLHDALEIHHHDRTVQTLLADRPMILVSGHFGNWEIGISVFGTFGIPMGVVAREMDNPYLNEWFRDFRQCTGHRMLPKKGGYGDMLATLEQGGKLALLGDQDAGPRGLFVDFFGRPASTFKSIALLAIEYDAVLFVGSSRRLPDDFENCRWVRYAVDCDAVIDPREIDADDPIREITQRFTTAIEKAVRRAPEQYFWLHRRWKHQPGERKRRRQSHQ